MKLPTRAEERSELRRKRLQKFAGLVIKGPRLDPLVSKRFSADVLLQLRTDAKQRDEIAKLRWSLAMTKRDLKTANALITQYQKQGLTP